MSAGEGVAIGSRVRTCDSSGLNLTQERDDEWSASGLAQTSLEERPEVMVGLFLIGGLDRSVESHRSVFYFRGDVFFRQIGIFRKWTCRHARHQIRA